MKKAGAFLARHRRLLLIALLTTTLFVSSAANRRRLEAKDTFTSLPVMQTQRSTPVAAYIAERDASYSQETAALTALISQETLDADTRQRAASQLQALVANQERQAALEAALAQSALAPCAAVVTDGSVTIVTQKAEITRSDSALVLTLAAAHAGAAPEDVRIITAE